MQGVQTTPPRERPRRLRFSAEERVGVINAVSSCKPSRRQRFSMPKPVGRANAALKPPCNSLQRQYFPVERSAKRACGKGSESRAIRLKPVLHSRRRQHFPAICTDPRPDPHAKRTFSAKACMKFASPAAAQGLTAPPLRLSAAHRPPSRPSPSVSCGYTSPAWPDRRGDDAPRDCGAAPRPPSEPAPDPAAANAHACPCGWSSCSRRRSRRRRAPSRPS